MCIQYPEIIITSPTEPAAFCAVPQTIQENLLTTNYEQWCALYSMNEDDISLAFVSRNLKKQKEQSYEEDYEYGEEYRYEYEYDEFEDDEFLEEYQQSPKRQTLDDEFNNYNETHSQKYEGYDNNEYDCYYDENDEYDEGFDYEYDFESDGIYDIEDDFYMEKKPISISNKPRLNYGILANAINRRFNKTTDSDVSEEEEIDEFETENIETKIIFKNVQSFKITSEVPNDKCNLIQETIENCNNDGEMFDYLETIKDKFSQKNYSTKAQSKSSFSFVNNFFSDLGKPGIISNSHGGRSSFLTHRKCSSLQNYIFKNIRNDNNLCSKNEDYGNMNNDTIRYRKRGFSLSEWDDFIT